MTRAISDRMATTRATAGDAPITSGVDVAVSSTDSAPGSVVGTRSVGGALEVNVYGKQLRLNASHRKGYTLF